MMSSAAPAMWEYRIWPDDAGAMAYQLQTTLHFVEEPPRTDTYFMATARAPAQPKLRGGARFDIKELLAREAGLELWRPVIAAEFPFDDEDRATLARLYPAIPHSLQSLAALRDAFLTEGPEITVDKKRQIATEPGGLRAEIAAASLGEGARTTLCLEHESAAELARHVDRFGFSNLPNLSYSAWLRQHL